jgi:hypothetical protein
VAARHRLEAAELLDWLLPGQDWDRWHVAGLDWDRARRVQPVLAALEEAARMPPGSLQALRDPAVLVWPRRTQHRPRCMACNREDLRALGEPYDRVLWLFGGAVLCPIHGCRLSTECLDCGWDNTDLQAARGQMRLCCRNCDGPRLSRSPLPCIGTGAVLVQSSAVDFLLGA